MTILLDELNRFLEDRLEEFLQNNPHLELQALDEQLKEQQVNTQRSLLQLQQEEQRIQAKILETAREVELWHKRVSKATAAGRPDLAEPAQHREAALFRHGNQLWGEMQGIQKQIQTLQSALEELTTRRSEVKLKLTQVEAERKQAAASQTVPFPSWSNPIPPKEQDPLEAAFQSWETDQELEDLKRNLRV